MSLDRPDNNGWLRLRAQTDQGGVLEAAGRLPPGNTVSVESKKEVGGARPRTRWLAQVLLVVREVSVHLVVSTWM